MVDYNIIVKASVEKDIRKIPAEIISRIFEHIEALSADPFPHESRKLTGQSTFTGFVWEITGLFMK
jgi:mRNA-degrading endonuclease RelE of RelBE toxin-antitoxin system